MLKTWKFSCDMWLIVFGVFVAVILRIATGFHPYSGENTPPMFGDYEAQRHWMEITTNLPIGQWYWNSNDNNLTYWGLDYPPLTAYHMYLCGFVAGTFFNPNYTALHTSRGYESDPLRIFMRSTVLLSDFIVYIPAIIIHNLKCHQHNPKSKQLSIGISTVLALLYPGQILIDHGHFQYNCVSLGLFIFAVTALIDNRFVTTSILFVMALNYKQMELYHALPFFIYILSSSVPKRPQQSTLKSVVEIQKIALVVLAVFSILWFPFLFRIQDCLQVVQRIFPLGRGIFEDKVANFWCTLNVLFKLKNNFSNEQLFHTSLLMTITALFPSSMDLFLRPNRRKILLAVINSSLAFFLFSFQVHEKSILLPVVPVLLYYPQAPIICFWFSFVSIFSMLPLLIKDHLGIATLALTVFYTVVFRLCILQRLHFLDGLMNLYRNILTILLTKVKAKTPFSLKWWIQKYRILIRNRNFILTDTVLHILVLISLIGCIVLTFFTFLIRPPSHLPHLFSLLISVYSAVHFFGFFIYFNIVQIQVQPEYDIVTHKFKLH